MTTIVKTTKTSVLIYILLLQACSFGESKSYLRDKTIQNVLEKTIDSLLVAKPIPNYITVFFTESKGKTYVFVTGLLSADDFKTKYYLENGNKWILIGYSDLNLEERFANQSFKKPEIIFKHRDEVSDIFDGNSVTYEIKKDNTIKRIIPNDEIWELQFLGRFEPLPEPPRGL